MAHTIRIDYKELEVHFLGENPDEGAVLRYNPDDFTLQTDHDALQAQVDALDHGADLAGLEDDDHTQYLLANGTRSLSGSWDVGGYNLPNIGKLAVGNATVDGTYAALIKGDSALKVQSAAAADLATFDNTKILFGKDLDMDGNLLYSIGELKDVAKAAIGSATVDGSYALLVKSNTPLKLQDAAAAGSATFYVANTGRLYVSSTDTYKRIYLCNTDFNFLDDAASSTLELRSTRANGHIRFEATSKLTFSINFAQSTYLTSSQFQIGVPTYFTINDASTNTVLEALRVQRGTTGTAAPGIGAQLNFQVETSTGGQATAAFWAAKWTDPVIASGLDSDVYMACNSAGSYVYPLYVDGANQRVGIFDTTPSATLDVNGDVAADTYALRTPLAAYTQTYSTASRTVNNPTSLATFRPMGEMYLYDNSTATTITTGSTWTQVQISFTDGHLSSFDTPTAYELRYTGATTTAFHLGCTVSLKAAAANQTIKAVLVQNATVDANQEYTGGTILNGGTIRTKTGSAGDEVSTAIHIMTSLATNDTLSLFVQNTTSTNDITIIDCNLFGMGITQDLADDIANVKQNLNQVIDDLQTIDLLQ